MRLSNYLNEEYKPMLYDKSIIDKDCSLYLKHLKNADDVELYRNMNIYGSMYKIKPRKDRMPKDMPLQLHKYIDTLFYNKFGWRARSEGVFCKRLSDVGVDYGVSTYKVYPIGNYKVLWSPIIIDLYLSIDAHSFNINLNNFENIFKVRTCKKCPVDIEDFIIGGTFLDLRYEVVKRSITKEKYLSEEDKDEIISVYKHLLIQIVDTYKQTTVDKIDAFIDNEIILKCNEYYAVNTKLDISQEFESIT